MQTLIMHGSYGSPDENWFRWLEQSLVTQGHEVILQQFPVDDWDTVTTLGEKDANTTPRVQSLESWEKYFVDHILPIIQGQTINFVGHSSAPIFILHMLEKYDFRINKAVFVAPFFDIPDRAEIWQFYPVNKTFYRYDFDFELIKSKISHSTVIYGDNDPYVPSSEPPLFAKKLGADAIVIPGGRHCGSNFREFPELLPLL